MNLEKKRGYQNQIRKLIFDQKEIDNDAEILDKIKNFYETLFKKQSSKIAIEIEKLCAITTPSLKNDQTIK